jgi:Holliday junction resolvase RusA-like endonuclease
VCSQPLTGSLLAPPGADPDLVPLFAPTEPHTAILRFVVFGEAKSAGSKRAFRHPHSGRIILTESVKGSKNWQGQVAAAAAEAHAGALLDGPLRVWLTFYRPRPRSHYGSGRNAGTVKSSAPRFPHTRPDVLKLARGVEDACTGIVWTDDARIVSEIIDKRWGEPARVEVAVERL